MMLIPLHALTDHLNSSEVSVHTFTNCFELSFTELKSSLYSLDVNPLSDIQIANIFSQPAVCLFILLSVISKKKFLIIIKSELTNFPLYSLLFDTSKKPFSTQVCINFLFSSKSFVNFGFTFISLIYFVLTFV